MNKFSSEKFQIPPSFPFPLMNMNGQLHDNYAFVFNLNDHEPFLYLTICFVRFLAEGDPCKRLGELKVFCAEVIECGEFGTLYE